jgi:hypothetical protein
MEPEEAASLLQNHPDFRLLRRLHISDAHVFAENVSISQQVVDVPSEF